MSCGAGGTDMLVFVGGKSIHHGSCVTTIQIPGPGQRLIWGLPQIRGPIWEAL